MLSYRVPLNSWFYNTDWFYIKLSNELVNSLSAYIFEIHLERKIIASKMRSLKVPIIYETVIFSNTSIILIIWFVSLIDIWWLVVINVHGVKHPFFKVPKQLKDRDGSFGKSAVWRKKTAHWKLLCSHPLPLPPPAFFLLY